MNKDTVFFQNFINSSTDECADKVNSVEPIGSFYEYRKSDPAFETDLKQLVSNNTAVQEDVT